MDESIRVLHVDDDPEFADLASTLLEREDDRFVVETATGAEAALDRLEEGDVDCVVSDYEMPRMDGVEFLRAVREDDGDLPFILFTGKGSERVASEAISAGATDYLQKRGSPDQYTLLANRIDNAVAQYRTDRRRRRSEERYRQLIENSPAPIFVYSEDGETLYVNDAAVDYLNADSREEIVGMAATEFGHPDDREQLRSRLDHLVEEREPVPPVEQRAVALDGETKHHVVASIPITFDGAPAFQAIAYDITERKQRDRVIEEINAVGADFAACATVDEVCDRTVEAAEAVLAFDRCVISIEEEGILTVRARSAGMPDDGNGTMSVEEGLAGKTYRTGDSYLVDDLRGVDAAMTQGSYRSAISAPVGDHGVFQAVSGETGAFEEVDLEFVEILLGHAARALDRLDRQRELARQSDRLEEFAGFVSHDLATPIAAVRGRLELALDTGDTDHVEAALSTLDRVDELRTDLANVLRTGETVGETRPVALDDLARSVWSTLDPPATATLRVEDPPRIRADPDAMRRLAENLLRNAVEHAGDAVTVRVGRVAGGFYVADDGPGIHVDESDEAFKPGVSTADGGMGLGLASVHQIVRAHGWEIGVTEDETGGARFEVTGVEVLD